MRQHWPVQLVKRGDKYFLRLAPYTITFPTVNQIKARIEFGKIVRSLKGLKGFDPETGLPIVAATVAKLYRGKRFGRKVKLAKWQEYLLENPRILKEFLIRLRIIKAIAQAKALTKA